MDNKLLKRGAKYTIILEDGDDIGVPTAKGDIIWYENNLHIPDNAFCGLRQLRTIKKSFLNNYIGSY